MIGGPNDDNEDDFRSGRGYVDEIFILKRLGKNPERRQRTKERIQRTED